MSCLPSLNCKEHQQHLFIGSWSLICIQWGAKWHATGAKSHASKHNMRTHKFKKLHGNTCKKKTKTGTWDIHHSCHTIFLDTAVRLTSQNPHNQRLVVSALVRAENYVLNSYVNSYDHECVELVWTHVIMNVLNKSNEMNSYDHECVEGVFCTWTARTGDVE